MAKNGKPHSTKRGTELCTSVARAASMRSGAASNIVQLSSFAAGQPAEHRKRGALARGHSAQIVWFTGVQIVRHAVEDPLEKRC